MRDALVLILDEPTSALDALAESGVYERLARLTRGKTTILISHRFSTVRVADRILVRGGRPVEEGAHEQLMAGPGHSARVFVVGAERYR